ncbi:hypothetical protein IWC96_05275 [Brevundimonas sp. BAL450]|uniref:hypothetical protein n=1 Tax=Brevundimonas sp. BAL450 TaxID=1708162 RepID=UPI0018CAE2BB|nr:hypothetical protein [Brevundimonas sp. BAL450]MBG7614693.1 hypothetical protein [Brevundimonas sp. BAL450]
MPSLDEEACADEIVAIFDQVTSLTPMQIVHAVHATRGKLYEVYCVGRLLAQLHGDHGLTPTYTGTGPLRLKASGGYADPLSPHFMLFDGGVLVGRVYTDVEVMTLGAEVALAHGATITDLSAYHEIDIVVLADQHQPRPSPGEVLIGVECKAVAEFEKSFIREVLGRRRELSFYRPDTTAFGAAIMASPASDYFLAYIDPAGNRYSQSPAVFEVRLEHWVPTI